MKTTTKVSDLLKLLALRKAEAEAKTAADAARLELEQSIALGRPVLPAITERATNALRASEAAREAFQALPKARRDFAETTRKAAEEIALAAARCSGGYYSGETTRCVGWATGPWTDKQMLATARTVTSEGNRYSRSCKYSKTDAAHVVTLDPRHVHALVEAQSLRQHSVRDRLELIALAPDGRARWVTSSGKRILWQEGWIIGCDITCYHSTISRAHAVKGHARKREQLLAAQREADEANRALRFFRRDHGLGESATLPPPTPPPKPPTTPPTPPKPTNSGV